MPSDPRERQEGEPMTEAQIKHLVDRFLSWKLPENFRPDAGISFKPTFNDHMPFGPMEHEPSGTNLFDAAQARAMVLHMIDGLPSSPPPVSGEIATLIAALRQLGSESEGFGTDPHPKPARYALACNKGADALARQQAEIERLEKVLAEADAVINHTFGSYAEHEATLSGEEHNELIRAALERHASRTKRSTTTK